MAPVVRPDPYTAYNFLVTVNGVSDDGQAVSGSFKEISGLKLEIPSIDYRNGSEDITVRKMPGLIKYENIVLKRGITGDINFWSWVLTGIQGAIQRADGSIMMLDENRAEVMRWNFRRGWACKYEGPGFNAANNEIAMETVEICHEGLEVDV